MNVGDRNVWSSVRFNATRGHMHPDEPNTEGGPPTEEIYLQLRELESAAADARDVPGDTAPAPVLAEDDPTGIKARIARLRAVLSDRGVDPPE